MSSLTIDQNTSTQCTSSPLLQLNTSALSAEEVSALVDLVEEATAPGFYVGPPSPTEDDSLHPGSPWVKASAYSFDILPLIMCHFATENSYRPLPFVRFGLMEEELYIFGTAGVKSLVT